MQIRSTNSSLTSKSQAATFEKLDGVSKAEVEKPRFNRESREAEKPRKPRVGLRFSWLPRNFSPLAMVVIGVIAVVAIAGAGLFIRSKIQANSAQPTTDQASLQLIDKVGLLIMLPSDETPTIATVTKVAELKDQPFFTNAQNDDKVLIYTNAKKAILYRPSTNKLVEVAPISFSNSSATGTGTTPAGTTSTPAGTTPATTTAPSN